MSTARRREASKEAWGIIKSNQITTPPVDVESIVHKLGAKLVYSVELEKKGISGLLYREGETAIVGINSLHSNVRKRFSIAHELGHLVLHQNGSFVDRSDKVHFRSHISGLALDTNEIEANTFAAALLMPKEILKKEIKKHLDQSPSGKVDTLISELASIFDVSNQAMEYRLKNLGVIDADF